MAAKAGFGRGPLAAKGKNACCMAAMAATCCEACCANSVLRKQAAHTHFDKQAGHCQLSISSCVMSSTLMLYARRRQASHWKGITVECKQRTSECKREENVESRWRT